MSQRLWRENAVAVIILQRVLARMIETSYTLRRFIILRSGKGLIFFNKNNGVNFADELKNENEGFRSV